MPYTLIGGVKLTTLADLYREISLCRACELAECRNMVVPGEGAADAEIMFIGEAPGFHEDQQGRPFVGAAGQFLNDLLHSIGLDRSKVYICNVIKCRPRAIGIHSPGRWMPVGGGLSARLSLSLPE